MADKAARAPDHQKYHRHAEYEHAVLIETAEKLKATDQGERGKRDAELGPHATEHNDGQHQRRFLESEGFRTDESLSRCKKCAGKSAEGRAGCKRRKFGRRGVDAERA